ncbi:MAG: M81 family metallopeptidase [Alphaproteobacteria bacterium]|nr:M81 family metallopeptidase [Alphaproteobacteria bacterium]
MPHRVLAASIKHETHAFNRLKTTLAHFKAQQFALGDEIPQKYAGVRLEMGGFLDAAKRYGWELHHPVCTFATPGGAVADEAFEFFCGHLVEGLKRAGKLDGVALALHGSMVTESHDDAEGEILRRTRAVVGPDIPVAVTLDPHCNVTREMARLSSIITAFRTSPHVDQYETALRAAAILDRAMRGEVKPRVYLARRAALNAFDSARTYTGKGPMIEALKRAAEIEREQGILCVSIHSGFSRSDFAEVGPSVAVTSDGKARRAREFAEQLMEFGWQNRRIQSEQVASIEEAVAAAKAVRPGDKPLILGDYGDAPGGGAYGDSTSILKALLDAGIKNAALAAIYDPDSAHKARAAGVGATVNLTLGGKHDPAFGGGPLEAEARVIALSDGAFVYKGPYGTGTRGSFGESAAVEVDGIAIILSTLNKGIYDLEQFRIYGIEPTEKSVLVVKCMQGHHAAFDPIGSRSIDVDSGGLTTIDIKRFPYRKVPRPVWPLDEI